MRSTLPISSVFLLPPDSVTAASKPQIIVHGDLDILLRTQVPFGRLDRRMPQQKLDLFQIPAILAAQPGAGTAQVVGAEAFDPDLLR